MNKKSHKNNGGYTSDKFPKEGRMCYSGSKVRIFEEDVDGKQNGYPFTELYAFRSGNGTEVCANYSKHGCGMANSLIRSNGPVPSCRPVCYMLLGVRPEAFCRECRESGPIRELTRLGRYFEIPVPISSGYEGPFGSGGLPRYDDSSVQRYCDNVSRRLQIDERSEDMYAESNGGCDKGWVQPLSGWNWSSLAEDDTKWKEPYEKFDYSMSQVDKLLNDFLNDI